MFIVTGASEGIGRALSLGLACRKQKVLALARNKNALSILQAEAPNYIDILSTDISTETGREQILSCLSQNTSVQGLVNNAAVMTPSGLLKDIDLEKWQYQMKLNVEAPLFLTKALIPYLKGGRVLNLTIYSSFNVNIGFGAYGISKAALNMMTQYYKAELLQDHIAVSMVLPGIVDTHIQKQRPPSMLLPAKNLLSPNTVSKFLTWLLLDTSTQQFSEKIWDIYDKTHHHLWTNELK